MVICENCGAVMHEEDLVHCKSWLSDYRGGTYEEYDVCPCGGDVREAEQCKSCGEYFDKDDMCDGYCEECLKEKMTVDNAIKCGEEIDARTEISLNGFLASVFSEEEIDQLLLTELEKRISSSREGAVKAINLAEEFCKEDMSWFIGWLERRKSV